MNKKIRNLWALTAGNVLLAGLSLTMMFGLMLALSVLAPEISTWPIFVTLGCGVVLASFALRYAKYVPGKSRVASIILNGCALSFHILVIGFFISIWARSTSEIYLIPEGYQGDVYVMFNVPDGPPSESGYHELTYRIPADGILRTRSSMPASWTQTKYFFQNPDGSLTRITNEWLTTIPETKENLTNDRDLGIFFPRTGRSTDDGCTVQYSMFYVGTKAKLLSGYRDRDLAPYLQQHPTACQSTH